MSLSSSASRVKRSTPFVPVSHRRLSSSRKTATYLMIACSQGLASEVRSLLSKSVITQKDISGKTALHYCTDRQSPDCAEIILQTDKSVIDFQDDEGYTALHLAVINGNIPVARLLLSKSANCNIVDKEKHSAVHWATVCGELECLDLLFEAGADTATADIHGAYPLHYAAQMCGSNSEMANDAEIGRIVLSKLIQYGADVNVQDQDGRKPLVWAASAGSSDAIVALVKAGASVTAKDKDGLNALHCAASRGHVDCIETLIGLCGAECDVIDSNGCTPLFYSVTLAHADCTDHLLQYGSEPNRQDRKGRTPAHCGASKGQLETLRLLSQHGANMWAKNIKGDVPLHEAIQSGRKDLVKWLLCLRSDLVNLSNNDGRTSLHLAALNSNVEMCKVLMDHKAVVNPIMKNRKGNLMTPLDAAISRGNKTCAKYLQLHGGVPAAKLIEKYGIHDAVGRIFSGKPELAREMVLSSELNSVSLESSMDGRSIKSRNIESRQDILSREFQKHTINENHLSIAENHKTVKKYNKNKQNKSNVAAKDSENVKNEINEERTNKHVIIESSEIQKEQSGADDQREMQPSEEEIEKLAESQLEVQEEVIQKQDAIPQLGANANKIDHEDLEKLAESQLEVQENVIQKQEASPQLGANANKIDHEDFEIDKSLKKKETKSHESEDGINGKQKNDSKRNQHKRIKAKSSSDTDVTTIRHIKVEKTFSDDNTLYKSKKQSNRSDSRKSIFKTKKDPQVKSKPITDDDTNGTISAMSSHMESETSNMTGTHKDSGYSDDPEEKFLSDRGDISSTTSLDCNPVRRVRKRRTRMKQKIDDSIPLTHISTVIGSGVLDNNDSPVIKLGFDDALKREKHILDNKEDVFKHKSKTSLFRRMSEESDKPKSHACLDQPAQKTKRITTSTVKKNRRNVTRESSNTSSNKSTARSSRSVDPPITRKDRQSSKSHTRSSRSVELPLTINSRAHRYLTAKYNLREPEEVITNMSKNMRKYYQEKQIFQKLSEIKRLQIKCSRGNEKILVKRLAEEHTKSNQMVGIKPYTGPLTLKAFEKYLYDVLREFSNSNHGKVPVLKDKESKYESFVLMDNDRLDQEIDPFSCSSGTHRCNHVNNAYATYPGRLTSKRNKVASLPKLSPPVKQQPVVSSVSQKQYNLSANSMTNSTRKTRVITSSKSRPGEPVTFEIKHGAEKNIFTLPTDEISNKKKWQVTFTIGMDKNNKQLGLTKDGSGTL